MVKAARMKNGSMLPMVRRRSLLLVFFLGCSIGSVGVGLGAGMLGSGLFSDVPAGSPYDAAVGELADAGVLRGKDDGLFHPDDAVTRGELALALKKFREVYVKGAAKVKKSQGSRSSRTARSANSASSASLVPVVPLDPNAGIVQFAVAGFSITEKAAKASVSVVRSGGKDTSLRVDYATEDGTAVSAEDYTNTTGSVSFAPNETKKNITVVLKNDTVSEGKETFRIILKNPSNGVGIGNNNAVVVTMLDDEAVGGGAIPSSSSSAVSMGGDGSSFSFGSSQYSVSENGGSIAITVVRSGSTLDAASVNYATSDGSGKGGSDFIPVSGKLDFAAGEIMRTFPLSIFDEKDIDGMKTVNLSLKSPSAGSSLGTIAAATLMIIDNEGTETPFGTGSLKFAKASYRGSEVDRTVVVTVQRVGGSIGTVTVDFSTSDGTAFAGLDFATAKGTLTFAPGETLKTFSITVLRDDTGEGEETLSILLSNPTGGAGLLVPSTSTVTING